ncbi:hypothetical protein BaRGS_00021222, partial [Batillaria attramentaria]
LTSPLLEKQGEARQGKFDLGTRTKLSHSGHDAEEAGVCWIPVKAFFALPVSRKMTNRNLTALYLCLKNQ